MCWDVMGGKWEIVEKEQILNYRYSVYGSSQDYQQNGT